MLGTFAALWAVFLWQPFPSIAVYLPTITSNVFASFQNFLNLASKGIRQWTMLSTCNSTTETKKFSHGDILYSYQASCSQRAKK
jgi:hypothetical protein